MSRRVPYDADDLSLHEYRDITKESSTIVYYTAKWCKPCQSIKPLYYRLKETAPPSVRFITIDIDRQGDIHDYEGLTSVPVFLFYQNGVKVDSLAKADPVELENKFLKFVAMEM